MTVISSDVETRSGADIKLGLDRYFADREAAIVKCAYSFDYATPKVWSIEDGPPPRELTDALEDPHVEKHAFNAQFERLAYRRLWKLKMGYKGWRCTMALAYMLQFKGRLDDVAEQIGLPDEYRKDKEGNRLIRLFSVPQKITSKNPHRWRDGSTDPHDWQRFGEYCGQDVVTEMAIERRLARFPVPEEEWFVYQLDQLINDRGKPVDLVFVEHAIVMVARRKAELIGELRDLTGIANPLSVQQFLPWARERGYPFADMQAESVKKVLKPFTPAMTEEEVRAACEEHSLDPDVVAALKMRDWAARISVKKYDKIRDAAGSDSRMRYLFQYGGASRTLRWAGRLVQTQNLPRTPKIIEAEEHLSVVSDIIRRGEYELLEAYVGEPMEALVGCVRSAFSCDEDHEFVVCDLSSIESAVIAWLTDCKRLLQVFYDGKDPYKDFATEFYGIPYDQVTKEQRGKMKPPTLGCGFRLGGGELRDGKRTGLWGYAENMGVDLTRDESHRGVRVWRDTYPEIPAFWPALERGAERTLRTGKPTRVGPLVFEWEKPFLAMVLPSGRRIRYYKPRLEEVVVHTGRYRDAGQERCPFTGRLENVVEPETFTKTTLSFMGENQASNGWSRIYAHGGVLIENCLAGDSLVVTDRGLVRLDAVTVEDAVWDGVEFVRHSGVAHQGEQKTIDFGGVRMTPEHRVLVGPDEWANSEEAQHEQAASAFARYFRSPYRTTDCDPVRGVAGHEDVRPAGHHEQVFDILNAGPRRRFTVVGRDGRPFIVHNCVQAIARDILVRGLIGAHRAGFKIVGSVHDEIITERRRGANSHGVEELREVMTAPIPWAPGLPLGAAGWHGQFYRKD